MVEREHGNSHADALHVDLQLTQGIRLIAGCWLICGRRKGATCCNLQHRNERRDMTHASSLEVDAQVCHHFLQSKTSEHASFYPVLSDLVIHHHADFCRMRLTPESSRMLQQQEAHKLPSSRLAHFYFLTDLSSHISMWASFFTKQHGSASPGGQ